MYRELRKLITSKSYCEIKMDDGDSFYGFITRADESTFDISTLEPIVAAFKDEQLVYDEATGDLIGVQADPEDIDHVIVKHTYGIECVTGIIHDVSHRIKPEVMKSLNCMRDLYIYKKPAARKSKKSPNSMTN